MSDGGGNKTTDSVLMSLPDSLGNVSPAVTVFLDDGVSLHQARSRGSHVIFHGDS